MHLLLSCRFENETSIRQSVEADIGGLKKVIDETNGSRMNIENEIEAVKEELLYLKKNHENVSLRDTSQTGRFLQVEKKKRCRILKKFQFEQNNIFNPKETGKTRNKNVNILLFIFLSTFAGHVKYTFWIKLLAWNVPAGRFFVKCFLSERLYTKNKTDA